MGHAHLAEANDVEPTAQGARKRPADDGEPRSVQLAAKAQEGSDTKKGVGKRIGRAPVGGAEGKAHTTLKKGLAEATKLCAL